MSLEISNGIAQQVIDTIQGFHFTSPKKIEQWLAILGGTLLILLGRRYFLLKRNVRKMRNFPGIRGMTDSFEWITFLELLPRSWLTFPRGWHWEQRRSCFQRCGSDVLALVTPWTYAFHLRDAQLIKEVMVLRKEFFPKPVFLYGAITPFGNQVVVSEGEEWKRHRKAVIVGFSEANNRMVFQETRRLTEEMVKEWLGRGGVCADVMEYTTKLALHVIANAAFGFKTHWGESQPPLPGFSMGFFSSLEQITQRMFATSLCPDWLLKLPIFGLSRVGEAKTQFLKYLRLFIEDARREVDPNQKRPDIFTSLILASLGTPQDSLSDADLIANIHILLFAGHETTAHTLTYALGLLAVHPEIQEQFYQEIQRVLHSKPLPDYEDLHAIPLAKAIMNETLRLFPSVTIIPKWAPEDTTLDGGKIFVPAGTRFNISVAGLHYNEKHWGPDVEDFKPSRFLGDYPRDAFIPFSDGPRSCLGKRFAQIEAQTVLILLVKNFVLLPTNPDPQSMFESFTSLTLTPKRPITLKFIPRR